MDVELVIVLDGLMMFLQKKGELNTVLKLNRVLKLVRLI